MPGDRVRIDAQFFPGKLGQFLGHVDLVKAGSEPELA